MTSDHGGDSPATQSMTVDVYGTQQWWGVKGRLHRVDDPAIICENGDSEWWTNGERNRVNGPAVICENGDSEWWTNGERNRVNGPAVIWIDRGEWWWVNNKLHRVGYPAAILSDGGEEWWNNGQLHRVDGPAVRAANGRQEWYYRGKLHRDGYYTCDFSRYYKRGVEYTLPHLHSYGRKILRFMKHVIFRSRIRDIRRRRVVVDTIFDFSGVYFPGLAQLIGSY